MVGDHDDVGAVQRAGLAQAIEQCADAGVHLAQGLVTLR